jgi:RNA polymerase sigma-70 factor (ECF subfamily)
MRPKDREIFLRYYYYLETTDEIAQKMHLSGSAVRSRLTRGRKTLKTILSKEVSS